VLKHDAKRILEGAEVKLHTFVILIRVNNFITLGKDSLVQMERRPRGLQTLSGCSTENIYTIRNLYSALGIRFCKRSRQWKPDDKMTVMIKMAGSGTLELSVEPYHGNIKSTFFVL